MAVAGATSGEADGSCVAYGGRVRGAVRMKCAATMAALLAALLFALPAGALDPARRIVQYKHTAWTVSDGAPPIIYALAQGADGYLWLGTASGLYRFDGAVFEPIPLRDAGPAPSRILTMMAARDGAIWVGYENGDIAVYRDGVLRLDRSVPRTDANMLDLTEGRDGAIWARVYRGERGLLRGANGRWEEIGEKWGFPAEWPEDLLAARDGAIWVATGRSILVLRPGSKRFERVARETSAPGLSEDSAGRIWLSDRQGTRVLYGPPGSKPGAAFPTASFPGWPDHLRFDRDGNLWVLNGDGVYRVRAPGDAGGLSAAERAARVEHFSAKDGLTADTAAHLIEDREGNIWVGTTLGLDQFRPGNVVPEPALASTIQGSGQGLLAASDGSIYAATSQGVFRIAPGGDPEPLAAPPSAVNPICEDADGVVWVVGRSDDLLRIQGGVARKVTAPALKLAPNRLLARAGCALDQDGVLWANANVKGLLSYRAGRWRPSGPDRAEDWVTLLVQGKDRTPVAWLASGALASWPATAGPPGCCCGDAPPRCRSSTRASRISSSAAVSGWAACTAARSRLPTPSGSRRSRTPTASPRPRRGRPG